MTNSEAKTGLPLDEAVAVYCSAESVERWRSANADWGRFKREPAPVSWDPLAPLGSLTPQYSAYRDRGAALREELSAAEKTMLRELRELLVAGELVAFGYEPGATLGAAPINVPAQRWITLAVDVAAGKVGRGDGSWSLIGVFVTCASDGSAGAQKRLGRGGRPPKPYWNEVESKTWVWLEQNGMPDTQAAVEAFMTELIEALGEEASTSTIRQRAKSLLDRFAAEQAGNSTP